MILDIKKEAFIETLKGKPTAKCYTFSMGGTHSPLEAYLSRVLKKRVVVYTDFAIDSEFIIYELPPWAIKLNEMFERIVDARIKVIDGKIESLYGKKYYWYGIGATGDNEAFEDRLLREQYYRDKKEIIIKNKDVLLVLEPEFSPEFYANTIWKY